MDGMRDEAKHKVISMHKPILLNLLSPGNQKSLCSYHPCTSGIQWDCRFGLNNGY